MKQNRPYRKHVYWVTGDEETEIRQELEAGDIKLKSAKGVMCTPLDAINRISSVAPDVWNQTCGRQGSWYRASEKRGLYLVVSSFPLEGREKRIAATITESDFVPPRLATVEDKKGLASDRDLMQLLPGTWKQVGEKEKRIYMRWAMRLGSEVKDYEELYLSHTANHANFINPRFFIQGERGIIPYSIDRSAHLCSSCVELFQILGNSFKKKLVAPCPGATIFARLKPDRYLLVERA